MFLYFSFAFAAQAGFLSTMIKICSVSVLINSRINKKSELRFLRIKTNTFWFICTVWLYIPTVFLSFSGKIPLFLLQADGKAVDGDLLPDANGKDLSEQTDGSKWQRPRLSRKSLMKCCLVKWIIASTAQQGPGKSKEDTTVIKYILHIKMLGVLYLKKKSTTITI